MFPLDSKISCRLLQTTHGLRACHGGPTTLEEGYQAEFARCLGEAVGNTWKCKNWKKLPTVG